MYYPVSALLIEFLILSIVDTQDSYGYEISQTVKIVADIKESTLYPILKKVDTLRLIRRNSRDVNVNIIPSPMMAKNSLNFCIRNGTVTAIQLTGLLRGGYEIDKRTIYDSTEKVFAPSSKTGL